MGTELHLLQLPFSLCQIALIKAAANCCCSTKRNIALLLEAVFQDLCLRAKERAVVPGTRFISEAAALRWLRAQAAPRSRSGGPAPSSRRARAGSGFIPAGTGRRPGRRGGPGRSRRPQHLRGRSWQAGAVRTPRSSGRCRGGGGWAAGAAGQGRAGPGAAPPAGAGPRAPGGRDPASSASSLPGRPFPALGTGGSSVPRPSACPDPSQGCGREAEEVKPCPGNFTGG